MWVTVPIWPNRPAGSETARRRTQTDCVSVSLFGEVETLVRRNRTDARARREVILGSTDLGHVEDGILVDCRPFIAGAQGERADRDVERRACPSAPIVLDGDVYLSRLGRKRNGVAEGSDMIRVAWVARLGGRRILESVRRDFAGVRRIDETRVLVEAAVKQRVHGSRLMRRTEDRVRNDMPTDELERAIEPDLCDPPLAFVDDGGLRAGRRRLAVRDRRTRRSLSEYRNRFHNGNGN